MQIDKLVEMGFPDRAVRHMLFDTACNLAHAMQNTTSNLVHSRRLARLWQLVDTGPAASCTSHGHMLHIAGRVLQAHGGMLHVACSQANAVALSATGGNIDAAIDRLLSGM